MATDQMRNKAELIFIPSPAVGHLASTLEFAKLITNRDNHLSITVLSIRFPYTPPDTYTTTLLASHPQIKLIDVPQAEPPSQEVQKSPEHYILSYMESLVPHVKATIQNIVSSYPNPVVGLVIDFFCVPMIDVGNELGIPSYLFLTSNVGFLGLMFSIQKRQIEDVFSNSDPELLIPGFSNLVPPRVLPNACFNQDGGYVAYHKLAARFRDTKGIIVNAFSELEQDAIDALSDDHSPPIYAIGPLLNLKGHPSPNLDQAKHDLILNWLDEQPDSSVVFLGFGSRGTFDPSQTREIALGLQRSGVRFLWALRSPPTTDNEEKNLPEGFLELAEGRGMLCEWAPQVEVLAHKAIGGFLSHCGWNSILESFWFGVPILTWPIYAEQQLNAFMMVKEWGLAVELRVDYRKGSALVVAEEIEKGLKHLMDKDNMVHKKVQEMKEKARKAVLSGGSSFISVRKLIDDMISS
ncbi:UDP-glycosyltransferase 71K2-like [Lotus japonicus]|uniref:UDP-glycosyltransferase 71K2-like n=1 Tax=Lotus japonicus TaxID=34305 RepID=UPI002582C9B2|nr:UDP-glycosyltransferase 71K2-like [Lotus japonicus]